MTNKRILALVLAVLMTLTALPVALAETEPAVVYGYSEGGDGFYPCDSQGTPDKTQTIDPTTITHLYLAPEESGEFDTLLMTDKTTLQSVVVLDLENYDLYMNSGLFNGYVNLTSVTLPDRVYYMGSELFANTGLTSFTLPDLELFSSGMFYECTSIEEIVNPNDDPVTLYVHDQEITIAAGETWKADFMVADDQVAGMTGKPFSRQLHAPGADKEKPVTWALDQEQEFPEGVTVSLTEDGLLTGEFAAEAGNNYSIYVTATNGEQTATGSVFVESVEGRSVEMVLADGITLKSGLVGEKVRDVYSDAVYTFEVDPAKFGTTQLSDVFITATDEYGDSYPVGTSSYCVYDNMLILAGGEELGDITIEPIVAISRETAAAAAKEITFPVKEATENPKWVEDWGDFYPCVVYSASLTVGQEVVFSLGNLNNEDTDTFLDIYLEDQEEGLLHVNGYDNDTVGYGEEGSFLCTMDGTYYFFCQAYGNEPLDECTFIATAETSELLPKNEGETECLDFTEPDDMPTPDEGDLWAWNNDTKTLTLKDGFTMMVWEDYGILLPKDATVVVEGKAHIVSQYESFECQGNVTFDLAEQADLLVVTAQYGALSSEGGLVKIKGKKDSSKMAVYALGGKGISIGSYNEEPVAGSVEITDCILYVQSTDDAIQVYGGDVAITGCDVTTDTYDAGISVEYYEQPDPEAGVTVVNSKLNLNGDYGIENNCGGKVTLTDCDTKVLANCAFQLSNDLTVTGGRLMAESRFNPVCYVSQLNFGEPTSPEEMATLTFRDVALCLHTGVDWMFEGEIKTVVIDTPVRLSNEEGVLYTGQWDEEIYLGLMDEGNYPTGLHSVMDTPVSSEGCGVKGETLLIQHGQVMIEAVGVMPEYYVAGAKGWIPTIITADGFEETMFFPEEPFVCGLFLPDGFDADTLSFTVTYALCEYIEGEGWVPAEDSEGNIQSITKNFTMPVKADVDGTYGDVNGDQAVNANDALMILKSVVNKVTLTPNQVVNADVNGDQKVNANDALMILKKVVDKIDKFPVEE